MLSRERSTSSSNSTAASPPRKDLAEELQISSDEVYDLIANLGAMYLLSLDQPLGTDEGDATMGDLVEDQMSASPEMQAEYAEERNAMREAIAKLPERERLLVEMHYFEGVTFEAISRMMEVSKQRISQLHARAIRRVREYLGDDTVGSEAMHDFTV